MSWLLALGGFAALIILHELGHFAAAKAVGMRVERFSLFFPPTLFKVRRGETEYGVGAIPLGGYVKISGMNPREPLPPEVQPRAYFRQPVWKRVVVIAAGPAMNVLLAFVILWGVFLSNGTYDPTTKVGQVQAGMPAHGVLRSGDRIVSIDGKGASGSSVDARQRAFVGATSSHRCAGAQRAGCVATTPARVVVDRGGRRLTFSIKPRYDARRRYARLGFGFAQRHQSYGVAGAAGRSVREMGTITSRTFSAIAHIFQAKQRKQLTGVVGIYETTRQSIAFSAVEAFYLLALISLSLALLNLFPFLPLDGGHIFWALVEKVRGKAIPFSVMERAGAVGFALVLVLFFIGLSNDINRLNGPGFGVH